MDNKTDKEKQMVSKGSKVKIKPGTKLMYRELGENYEYPMAGWNKAIEVDVTEEYGMEVPEYTVTSVGTSHSSMTGGGRDYRLSDGHYEVWIRSTFEKPILALLELV